MSWGAAVGAGVAALGSYMSSQQGGSTGGYQTNKYGGKAHRQQIASHWNETMRMAKKHGIHPLVAAGVRPSQGPAAVPRGGGSGASGFGSALESLGGSMGQYANQYASKQKSSYTREMEQIALAQEKEKLRILKGQNPAAPSRETPTAPQTTNDMGVIGPQTGQNASVYQQAPVPRKDQPGITEGAPAAETYYEIGDNLIPGPSQAYSEPLEGALINKGQYAWQGGKRLIDTWIKPWTIAKDLRKNYPVRPAGKGKEWRWTRKGTWAPFPAENKLFADPGLAYIKRVQKPGRNKVRVEVIKPKKPKKYGILDLFRRRK